MAGQAPGSERKAAEERQPLPRRVAAHHTGRIRAADHPGRQAEPLEVGQIALDLGAEARPPARARGAPASGTRGWRPGPRPPAPRGTSCRRLGGPAAASSASARRIASRPSREAKRLAILGLDDQRAQRLRHARGELADGPLRLPARPGRGSRRSEPACPTSTSAHPFRNVPGSWNVRPTGSSVVAGAPGVALRPQHHAGDTRPERHQHGLGLAHALREDEDRLALAERRPPPPRTWRRSARGRCRDPAAGGRAARRPGAGTAPGSDGGRAAPWPRAGACEARSR